MSLKIWLPLNGDLHNQGISNYIITPIETSPTFTAGKIGLCYLRANTSSLITNGLRIQDNLLSTFGTTASVAVWVKPLGTHTHYNGTILSSGNWNTKRWAFGVNQNNSQVDVLCGGYNNYISCTVPVNQWTHLVSTFNNGVCKLYKNGVYVGEKTDLVAFNSDANWTGICRETYANGYFGFNGCINDLRIYDHCLSAVEVKEISQGLFLHYKLNKNSPNILDSSGYNHNGTVVGTITEISNSARYSSALYSANGTSHYILTPLLYMPTDAVTFNIWFKTENKAPPSDYHILVDSIGDSSARLHYELALSKNGRARSGLFVNGTRYVDNCTSTTGCNGLWHMVTLTYDGNTVKRYYDGILENSTNVAITTGLLPSATLRLFKDGYSTYAGKEIALSDFRIYVTSLLDNDIKLLYNIGMKIDKNGLIHTNELYEMDLIKIAKNAITSGNIIEIPRLLYDNLIHIEPDGSLWIHLFHHNAPATNGYFENVTDELFEHSIYLNEHKWFNMELCNYVDKWEILTVRRYSSANDFIRNRWILPVNPMIATYEDVKWANLTLYGTAEGYNTYTSSNPSNYSGYWHFTAGTGSYLASSYDSTTYFGALGLRKAWNSGVASFNSNKSANVIKSGSIDVYLRIDNVKFLNCNQSLISKNINAWLTTLIIER